ncbi:MAG: sensor histidine kinase [Pseudomonadota bacterium]
MSGLISGISHWLRQVLQESEAERAEQAFLARTGALQAESLDFDTALSKLARLAVSHFSDWCLIIMVEPDRANPRLFLAGRDPDRKSFLPQLEEAYRIDARGRYGSGQAIVSGRPVLIERFTDAHLAAMVPDPTQLALFQRMAVTSYLSVPLIARGRVIGAIAFGHSGARRRFGARDLALAEELARRGALAGDNALVYCEARRAEAAVQRLNAELERRVAERTAELEAFSYSVSHDLRAPLRAIDGFSLVLLEDYGEILDPAGREYLARVRRASQRMAELIDAMLNLVRLSWSELRREPLDLSARARDIAEHLYQSEPARSVAFDIAGGLTATGDPRLLGAVLENLLGNAWKFTRKQADARIEFGVREGAGERIYFVRDNGAGFDMAYADKLFGAFQRLRSPGEFEGHGIGLATVQRIIARHGGRIWAEGAVGQGATFYFTLGGTGS